MEDVLTPEQWNDLRIELKQKHPELKDADLPYYEAEEEDMLSMIDYTLQMYKDGTDHINHVLSTYCC
ncbi:MAG: hypothetical protein COW63_03025 [Bacteroidetes bacterium CG18_big_fil_WC_8_21_14_2_50_41_14]|nr:MAG: hypothetical protein COW63_03025 [Bacteroidetes bacterium CG18_big_fil_WC_8_21_14_2_50_41_14]PIY33750.1 MAG: hypothetical protein COZ08_04695 [Bacteroidetes bacterium CG_4_10_14_3_um_filter_42_6]PJB55280.1 MAG: hypothetical protein CO098_17170 [Bacteroidetes bacterium CG_4_9_14_3_um_filter_41_19]